MNLSECEASWTFSPHRVRLKLYEGNCPLSFLCIRGVGGSQEVLSVYFYTNLSRTLTRPSVRQVEKPVELSDGFKDRSLRQPSR